MTMTDNYPVFVYGTLRHGMSNYAHILGNNTILEVEAVLHGAVMYDGGCPFVELAGDRTVHGELMYLNSYTRDTTMLRLDRLEGYSEGDPYNMYDRILTKVTVTDKGGNLLDVDAYVYVVGGGTNDWLADMPVVESGDWVSHLKTVPVNM